MNIILLIIDTLRYDHIGANGNDWIVTPNLDRLAASSWVYERSYCASYPTIPHRTDVMTGRYGSPFHPWRPLRFDVPTLPRMLAEEGYCTQLIHDTPHLVNGGHNFDWPFHAWTMVRGAEVDRPWIDDASGYPANWTPDPLFDYVDTRKELAHQTIATYVRANRKRVSHEDWNAARLFLTARDWLRDNARRDRFFLWLDCFDPHEPWDAPPEYVKLYDKTPGYDGRFDPRSLVGRGRADLPEEVVARIRAFYAAKVSWVDRWVGALLDALEETGLAERTALVVTADHGTNLYERGRFGKGYPVREYEAHTPFMVRAPGGGSGRSGVFVQPQDVLATVLGLAGVATPGDLDAHDVLTAAQRGGPGQRPFALTSGSLEARKGEPDEVLCTLLADDHYLQVTADPSSSILTRYGSVDNVAGEHPGLVQELHALALGELELRGTDPKLMGWIRGGSKGPYPRDCPFWDGWPGPAGFAQYWTRLYRGE